MHGISKRKELLLVILVGFVLSLSLIIFIHSSQSKVFLFKRFIAAEYTTDITTSNFGVLKTGARRQRYEEIRSKTEVMLRMTIKEKFLKRFYCEILRSSALFWNSTLLGDFNIILDEEDQKRGPEFLKQLNSIPGLTHSFYAHYEKIPKHPAFQNAASRLSKSVGYIHQLYSSFVQDSYTDKEIIAFLDSDNMFILPVIAENAMNKKGQLIAKGLNTFEFGKSWIKDWKRTTEQALGLPFMADFMTYFPVFLYRKTITGCRQYMLKHLNVTTVEEAIEKLSHTYMSPINVIMNYAYYFEHDEYEWHIDIGKSFNSLENYNKAHSPVKPLTINDIQPNPHLAVHTAYCIMSPSPLERALSTMYAHHKSNGNLTVTLETSYLQAFAFQDKPGIKQNHFDSWCKKQHKKCMSLVKDQFDIFFWESKHRLRHIDLTLIRAVEKAAKINHNINCPTLNLEQFRNL